jgi:alpha-amylase/alpha-mannosidase (GH57 family)
MSHPLYVAFLWHMHQPYYRDPFTGVYRLPWVRLHGSKDYLDMAAILEDYPGIRQTFNLVPSLLEQIIDYTDNDAKDTFLEVSLRKASDLTDGDRVFILENFFLANWDTMVRPFPRYYELLLKRGTRVSKNELRRAGRFFSESDFLDLQVLFNLAWIDPLFREKDPLLADLVKKGKGFTEEEKNHLMVKQLSLLREIIPKYRALSGRGQIEVSTTPFYHPILPLLWNTDVAREPAPDIRLPQRRFARPEDAREQIRLALDYYERIFGERPSGMWPSEGSVSEDVVRAFHEQGIKWIATDEDILARSLGEGLRGPGGNVLNPPALYSAYEFSGVSMIFRDHKISDLFGFVYSGWDPKSAATDVVSRLLQIRNSLPGDGPYVVPIILDGENAWEYYRNDANDFFRFLYEGLSRNDVLKTVTVSEYLRIQPGRKRLGRLAAGSWIYANFNVWIGHEEDNTAWDYLAETREALDKFQREHPGGRLDAAWKALYVAEGSDWNWWYGDDHSTEKAEEFDELFRLNLMKVYQEMGKDIPPQLYVPVLRGDRAIAPSVEIRGFINPKIDGIMTSYFEWYQGAHLEVGKSGGSMHMTEGLISAIYYGFNRDTLFIRVDPRESFQKFPGDLLVSVEIVRPSPFRIDVSMGEKVSARLLRQSDGEWTVDRENVNAAAVDVLECAIQFRDIQAKERDELNLFVAVRKGSEQLERCPWRGYISLTVPSPDFEAMMWY